MQTAGVGGVMPMFAFDGTGRGVGHPWPEIVPTLFDTVPLMPDAALKVWHWYRQHLNGNRMYRPELGRLFSQMCLYEAWLDQYNLLDMPPSIQTSNGDVKMNPDLQAYDKIMARTQKLWETMAINPVFLFSRGPTIDGVVEAAKIIQLHPGRGMDGVVT